MARKQRIIGYVVVDQASGGTHVEGTLRTGQTEADQLAKVLNAKHATTRFLVRPIHPE